MFRKLATTAVLAATVAGGFAAAPAEAQRRNRDGYHRGYDRGYGYDGYRRNNGYNGYGRGYDRRYAYGNRSYRGRCYDKGNGGLAIGAVAGGLLGNTIAGRGDGLLGTVIGAGAGGLLGRQIDRSDGRRC